MNNFNSQIREGFQLSPQQQWLWRSQQLNPTFPFRVQGTVLIEGELNLNLFGQILQSIVDQHEILRTGFVCSPGMTLPLQVIQKKPLAIATYDLSHLSPSEQSTQIELQWQELSQQPFDFEQGVVLSLSLITLADDQHLLLINLSALNADGTTFVNLVQEISHVYSACLQKQELTQAPLQYADIAQWQIELLESEETQVGKEFWQKLNINALEIPKLLLQRTANKKSSFHLEDLCVEINQQTVQKFVALSQTQQVPLATVLLASWQVLIWRFTQQPHVAIGAVADGRNYEELKTALGMLSKTLPLVTHLESQLKFSQVLQQVDQSVQEIEQWQEAFDWQAIPSNELDQVAFPICFEFQSLPQISEQADLKFSIQKLCSYTEQFTLKLSCLGQPDSLKLVLHYDVNAYNQADIQHLAEHFGVLLESVVTEPESTIAELNLLTDLHRQQLLVDFNQTQVDFSTKQCIHQRFEAQVEQTSDQIAVVFEDQQLTYRELNQRANQLAHYLQKLSVQPEVLVGICCDRSLDFIVALLGVLKAGGAYLPLDPAMPKERLTQILQDAQVDLLLTQQHLTQHLEGLTEQSICLDGDCPFAQESEQNCINQATVENLAYVIYTSGSTGTPKGVAIEHRQLLNYLDSILQRLALPEAAHFAMVSTFAADLGNTVIFPALCTGGCLHIISQPRSMDSEALAQYCHSHPIDCLKIVPSHLSALLTGSGPKAILPRQCLVLGGEALSWNLVETVQTLAPNCRILNHYGPTEATVGVLTYEVEPSNHVSETVPIGRPLANTQLYILDTHQQPVPIGAVGELYIGGSGLARGYLNSPELTAEKFISHPFNSKVEARLYKTGDLVRYLSDETIEFLGRTDHQIKIRGFRIELGEIEAVLKQHGAIAEAVVISKADATDELRLVAYVLSHQQETFDQDELHRWLKAKLPEYMLPSVLVSLKTLPLTANGKIDRAALPTPNFTRTATNFVAPHSPIEQTVSDIWTEVLQLEQVSIYDNFFELGGHSLLATQVVSRLRQVFSIELSLHHLFESPTIANLAIIITEKLAEQTDEAMLVQMLAELEELSEADAQAVLEGVHS